MKNIRVLGVLEVRGKKLNTLWRAESQVKANAISLFIFFVIIIILW
jgi:hypothetical protein